MIFNLAQDGNYSEKAEPRGPAWLRRAIGDDYFVSVTEMYLFGRDEADDSGLEPFCHLPKLRSLSLSNWRISEIGVSKLESLPRLERLLLQRTDVADAAMSRLVRLSRLRTLSLTQCPVTETGLASIARLANLEVLSLSYCDVSNPNLEAIGRLTKLRWLILDGTHVTDMGLAHLSGLVELQDLNLRGTRITDAGLRHLRRLPNLRTLDLTYTEISVAAIPDLQQMAKLEALYISEARFTPDEIATIRKSLPHIRVSAVPNLFETFDGQPPWNSVIHNRPDDSQRTPTTSSRHFRSTEETTDGDIANSAPRQPNRHPRPSRLDAAGSQDAAGRNRQAAGAAYL